MGIVTQLRDGLTNLMTGAGTAGDKRQHGYYALRHVDPAQVEAAYRSSWLMRKAVDLPAQDETRAWRRWQAAPAEIAAIESEERRLDLRHKVRRARGLARLHGGGAILLGVGGDDPARPLDPERVGRGALRYLHVLSRWELGHDAQRRDPQDPWFGLPGHFHLRGGDGAAVRIHPSRLVAFVGQPLPEASLVGAQSWFWGDPLLQSIEDAVKNADAAQNGFAALIDEAKVDVFGIPDMLSSLASRDYEERLLRRLSLAKLGQSTHNAKLKDAGETWETRQVAWAGMPEMIDRYLQLVAAAADVPLTRFLGQAPAGLNATGESDLRNYYDAVAARQENELRPLLERIDAVMLRSLFGAPPAGAWFEFAPLWQVTPRERAEVDRLNAEVAAIDARAGLLPREALAAGRRGRVVEDGVYPGFEAALAAAPGATTGAAR